MFVRDPNTARIGEEILPFEMGYLPEFFQKKAEVELHDSHERRIQGLRLIKELMKNDKNLKELEFDDDFLLLFLLQRKFNVAKAFSHFKSYVNLRRKYKSMFQNIKFESVVKAIKCKGFTFLPYRCQDGCAIIHVKLDNWNPEDFPVEEVKKMLVVFLVQSLREEPLTQVNGFKVIFDVKSNPIRHIRHCTPTNMYLMYHGTQECLPARFKGIHIVNNSLTFKTGWFLVKPFLTDKLKKRIHFHDKPETLFNFFPRSVLPVEYGGEIANCDMTHWLRNVMQPEKLAMIDGGAHF